jgi:predicted O-linked N-acetylglucosamine transferase (SPINDLY family)
MKYSEKNSDRAYIKAAEPADERLQNAFYFNNLGHAFKGQGRLDDAIGCFHKAVERDPDFAEAYNNLGNAYKFKGDLKKAVFYYQKALYSKPQNAEAYYNLGILHQENGSIREAMSCYQKAVLFKPDFVDAYFNLGNACRVSGKLEEATRCYQTALKVNPDYAEAYNGMGTVLQEQGKPEEAYACYQKHMQLKPNTGVEVKASLLLPVICESTQSIVTYRKTLSENIEKLNHTNLRLQHPSKQIGKTNFYLAYHGLNNKHLQKKIARFFLDACPDLGWQASFKRPRCRKYEKIKIGIISQNLRGHTIGYLNHGLIKFLDREKFHVTVFSTPGMKDYLTTVIADAADEAITLPPQLSLTRQIIAQHALNILLYLDIGMDPFTYFLAFSRLAPVQCTTWGHPDTTGISNIDYYISSEKAEPPGAQAHYSEKLILFNQFPMYCHRPEAPTEVMTRKDLKLPEDGHLYACTQSLFKVHPDFDEMIARILRRDPNGIILFFEGKHAHWTKLQRERFARTLPDVSDRVRFMKRLPQKDFLAFLRIPHVILDTPHFSGGYTSLLALALGAPIVTLPGEFMRGRLTYALYKQMDIMDCVADDVDAYVNIACKIANDSVWCEEISNKIKASSRCLYENLEPVHELEHFFQWAIERH